MNWCRTSLWNISLAFNFNLSSIGVPYAPQTDVQKDNSTFVLFVAQNLDSSFKELATFLQFYCINLKLFLVQVVLKAVEIPTSNTNLTDIFLKFIKIFLSRFLPFYNWIHLTMGLAAEFVPLVVVMLFKLFSYYMQRGEVKFRKTKYCKYVMNVWNLIARSYTRAPFVTEATLLRRSWWQTREAGYRN